MSDVYWSGYITKTLAGVGSCVKVQPDVTYDGPRHLSCTIRHNGCTVNLDSDFAKDQFYRILAKMLEQWREARDATLTTNSREISSFRMIRYKDDQFRAKVEDSDHEQLVYSQYFA